MQINPQNVFNPYIQGPGFNVTISTGTILLSGAPTTVPQTIVAVSANTTTYAYLSLTTGLVTVNTSGFPGANAYPIAIITSGYIGITGLIDSRPDIYALTGVSASADSAQSVSTTQAISFLSALNTFVKATSGAGGITLTLPSAAAAAGQSIRIIKVDTGVGGVTLNTTGGQTINGLSTYVLTNQWQTVSVESDNSNWIVVSTAG